MDAQTITPYVEQIHNPRLRPDHKDVSGEPVVYARPKASFLDPQGATYRFVDPQTQQIREVSGENKGFNPAKHTQPALFRMLRRQQTTNAAVSPDSIESYSTTDFSRTPVREMRMEPRNVGFRRRLAAIFA